MVTLHSSAPHLNVADLIQKKIKMLLFVSRINIKEMYCFGLLNASIINMETLVKDDLFASIQGLFSSLTIYFSLKDYSFRGRL